MLGRALFDVASWVGVGKAALAPLFGPSVLVDRAGFTSPFPAFQLLRAGLFLAGSIAHVIFFPLHHSVSVNGGIEGGKGGTKQGGVLRRVDGVLRPAADYSVEGAASTRPGTPP